MSYMELQAFSAAGASWQKCARHSYPRFPAALLQAIMKHETAFGQGPRRREHRRGQTLCLAAWLVGIPNRVAALPYTVRLSDPNAKHVFRSPSTGCRVVKLRRGIASGSAAMLHSPARTDVILRPVTLSQPVLQRAPRSCTCAEESGTKKGPNRHTIDGKRNCITSCCALCTLHLIIP